MSEYTYEMSNFQLGQAYLSIEPNLRVYLDHVIAYGSSKIATIKFLRAHLGISLQLAKVLYDERQKFLQREPNPFGW